ncbi:hypothetical protein CLV88_10418 [Shimia abyssi]|uniref:CBU-0592-like domain-containing protein n=1 Tax=Shimia abyssi TaxID=1662395 RepID=A0A2P8FE05_9RHOB|nr:hypothetical protein CLV88_10418 [Shimia abyssi]
MTQETLFEIAGLIGVAFYLGSYALLQAGVLKGNGYVYATLNLLAASLVLVSLFNGWNLWSAIIQTSWIVISVVGMTRVWLLTRGLRFSEEEEALRARHFSHMRRLDAKRLFRASEWRDGVRGEELTKADTPVTRLSYVMPGGREYCGWRQCNCRTWQRRVHRRDGVSGERSSECDSRDQPAVAVF